MNLWNELKEFKKRVEFVDLSHAVCDDTPIWSGFEALRQKEIYNFKEHKFTTIEYSIVSQFGTHIDAPGHFTEGGRLLHELEIDEMILPLVVMDFSKEAKEDADFVLQKSHILEFESKNGQIPKGSFVALRTDWSKRGKENFNNYDENNVAHYPGWCIESAKFLIEERKVSAIGHETSDTDASKISLEAGYLPVETYVLSKDVFQVELLKDLDKMPAMGSIILISYPKVINAPGFTARCIGIKNKE